MFFKVCLNYFVFYLIVLIVRHLIVAFYFRPGYSGAGVGCGLRCVPRGGLSEATQAEGCLEGGCRTRRMALRVGPRTPRLGDIRFK